MASLERKSSKKHGKFTKFDEKNERGNFANLAEKNEAKREKSMKFSIKNERGNSNTTSKLKAKNSAKFEKKSSLKHENLSVKNKAIKSKAKHEKSAKFEEKSSLKSEISTKFELKNKANVAYAVAGYPNLNLTREFLQNLDRTNIDILELGIAYSDPIADGAVIFEAAQAALKGGADIYAVFKLLKSVKTNKILVFLVYYNLIFSYGLAKFVREAKSCGIRGLIVPELPYEESDALFAECEMAKIALIPLVSVTTSDKRLAKILSRGSGFVYALGSVGITGGEQVEHARLENLVSRIKKHTNLPVFVGFGVKTRKDVLNTQKFADGAIVGTSFVRSFANCDLSEVLAKAKELFG